MSFPINDIGFGSGALGSPNSLNAAAVNSYARVTEISSNSATIILQAAQIGAYENFSAGNEILFHVSASTGTNYTQYLGCWALAKITAVSGDILTLDTDLTKIIPAAEVAHYYCQVITVAQFENLTLDVGTQIRPLNYSATNYYGGIVAIKCSDTLTFSGGHIDLSDAGIPVASKALRPVMSLESNATTDTSKYAGWENFATKEHFTLQAGDGAAFIIAKTLVCHENSRIGNINSYGSQFCRGASDSVGTKPANITNVGGSSILIAAETLSNFTPKILSKYRSGTAGQGICRCYIATNSALTNDEGLYSYDILNNPARVMKNFNIRNFGGGWLGDLTDSTVQLNNYARITAIADGRKKLSYTGKTSTGLAQINNGALVMIHCNHKDSKNVQQSGRFILANVISDTGTELTLDFAIPNELNPETYAMQVVSVAQVNNFTLAKTNNATPKFNGTTGGILALAVKNHCNLSGGQLNVEGKGGGAAYGVEGLKIISNSGMQDRLPIGQGHGSVFLLAKSLTLNNNSRIGASYSGGRLGGYGWQRSYGYNIAGGGYKAPNYESTGGSGAGGGVADYNINGGYGSNGVGRTYGGITRYPYQGAHIMIVADVINNFNLNAISTGGQGAANDNTGSGGAGYGGGGSDNGCGATGGGYNGGGGGGRGGDPIAGGGSSGWAFIFCNNAVNPDYTNVAA